MLVSAESSGMAAVYGDGDISGTDTLSLSGGLGQKGDFDRRKKKK